MRFTLSNGVSVEEVQRDGYKEIVLSGNDERELTDAEWDEASRYLIAENGRRIRA